jgi:hypothetical protein
MKIGVTEFQRKNIEKLASQYSEIGRKPSFTVTNGRVFAADRLGMSGKEYSEMATALTDLAKKIVRYMAAVKYAQEKLGDDFIKMAVEEYG